MLGLRAKLEDMQAQVVESAPLQRQLVEAERARARLETEVERERERDRGRVPPYASNLERGRVETEVERERERETEVECRHMPLT